MMAAIMTSYTRIRLAAAIGLTMAAAAAGGGATAPRQRPIKMGPEAESMLSYSGRAVIDPDKHEMRLLDMKTGTSNTTDTGLVQPQAVRHYEIKNDQLEITLKDAGGKTVGITSWKKVK